MNAQKRSGDFSDMESQNLRWKSRSWIAASPKWKVKERVSALALMLEWISRASNYEQNTMQLSWLSVQQIGEISMFPVAISREFIKRWNFFHGATSKLLMKFPENLQLTPTEKMSSSLVAEIRVPTVWELPSVKGRRASHSLKSCLDQPRNVHLRNHGQRIQ